MQSRQILLAGLIAVVCPTTAGAQQVNTDDSGFDPYAMRRIPGTDMPSLRGTTSAVGEPQAVEVFGDSTLSTGEDTDENAIAGAAPIPLSSIPQVKAAPQASEPAVRSELPSSDFAEDVALEPRQNARTERDQPLNNSGLDEDPFGPTGFRLGTSVVNLRLEQSIGYSTNLDQTSEAVSGAFSETNVTASAVSDWSRHEFRIDADGTYRKAFNSDIQDRPTGNISAALRLDLIDGLRATMGANYGYTTESLTSDNLSGNVSERPGIHTYGANVELARTDRRLNGSLRGAIERTQYEDATLAGGGVIDQLDRNANLITITGRLGYDTGAVTSPFVQGAVGWRRFDEEVDRNGDQRNSATYDLRAGLSFDNGEKLNGEISVGYLREEFEEGSLEALEGYSINGDLVWSPQRDTTIALNAATALNPSTEAGNNGSISYTAGFDITRQATDRLSLNLNGSVTLDVDDDGDGNDTTWAAGMGAQYWMNRYMAIAADIDYTQFDDGDGLESYEDATITLGIILQR